jgi:hypothetical protein
MLPNVLVAKFYFKCVTSNTCETTLQSGSNRFWSLPGTFRQNVCRLNDVTHAEYRQQSCCCFPAVFAPPESWNQESCYFQLKLAILSMEIECTQETVARKASHPHDILYGTE